MKPTTRPRSFFPFFQNCSKSYIFYFHPDHLGSSNYITNLNDRISQHMEYLPFGESLVEEHKNSNNSPYKFNGKELDEETGNYYYGARYYDPKFSMWLSVDPMAEKYPGWSPYNYTLNNPINLTDPDGKSPIQPLKIIVGGKVSAIKKYKNQITAATGGFYTIQINNSGNVSLIETGIGNLGLEMTSEQKAFYKYYSKVVNSDNVIKQRIVENSKNTPVDSWILGRLDIEDVKEFDKSKGATSNAGAIIHSTIEQYEKSKMGFSNGEIGATKEDPTGRSNYLKAHKTAVSAENMVNGNYRGVNENADLFYEKDGTQTLQTIKTTKSGGINVQTKKVK